MFFTLLYFIEKFLVGFYMGVLKYFSGFFFNFQNKNRKHYYFSHLKRKGSRLQKIVIQHNLRKELDWDIKGWLYFSEKLETALRLPGQMAFSQPFLSCFSLFSLPGYCRRVLPVFISVISWDSWAILLSTLFLNGWSLQVHLTSTGGVYRLDRSNKWWWFAGCTMKNWVSACGKGKTARLLSHSHLLLS